MEARNARLGGLLRIVLPSPGMQRGERAERGSRGLRAYTSSTCKHIGAAEALQESSRRRAQQRPPEPLPPHIDVNTHPTNAPGTGTGSHAPAPHLRERADEVAEVLVGHVVQVVALGMWGRQDREAGSVRHRRGAAARGRSKGRLGRPRPPAAPRKPKAAPNPSPTNQHVTHTTHKTRHTNNPAHARAQAEPAAQRPARPAPPRPTCRWLFCASSRSSSRRRLVFSTVTSASWPWTCRGGGRAGAAQGGQGAH